MTRTYKSNRVQRTIEILSLTILAILNLLTLCWGPPGPPPTVPVGNAEMSVITIAAVAVYGFWKMR